MNFALFMLVALLLTGIIWLADAFWLRKRRIERARAAAGAAQFDESAVAEPTVVEYAKSFFPVILVVFFIRSFLVEPFKIPSGSMMPTLLIGDFILVNKYTYGLRVPILNNVFYEVGHPQRGDVMVFRYPKDLSLDYIKRVVGLPGDRIEYRNKQLFLNGQSVAQQEIGNYEYVGPGLNQIKTRHLKEQLGGRVHDILIDDSTPVMDGEITVPEGHYFVIGDNRDNSNDSRFWGFVPENNIVGRAFYIWMSFDHFDRIGNAIE
jgi:signal peptidase I